MLTYWYSLNQEKAIDICRLFLFVMTKLLNVISAQEGNLSSGL